MLARLKMLWVTVRDSLWFLPATITLLAAVLALILIETDRHVGSFLGESVHWLWGGGAEGTRGVLSAIAGGLITVTGVVFSVTIVALQLASSQFTPRLLRNFTADRSNQAVLAVLIGTFTYALLVLRAVRSESDSLSVFVPRIAATVALVLVLVSIGFLIYFIDHASKSIQLAVILDRVTRQTKHQVHQLLPDAPEEEEHGIAPWDEPDGIPATVLAKESGYLQAVDETALIEICEDRDLYLRMEPHIGQFVLEGRPLVSVWPEEAVDGKLIRTVRRAFVLGHEPTPEQDIEFGVIELSDIAVKALSPSVNDPTTAMRCIDRLGEILVAIGMKPEAPPTRKNRGKVRFLATPLDYERVVGLAFDQIRHFGSANPTISRRLVDLLTQMLTLVPPERRGPLRSQLEAVVGDARESIESPIELAAFERMLGRHQLNV